MESWRKVWREGIAPLMQLSHLKALERGLETDDPRLMQGGTTAPPPLQCVMDWPVTSGCGLAYPYAFEESDNHNQESDLTVSEVESEFASMCFSIDQRLGEPAGCRHWLNWWDETPRCDVLKLMLEEVQLSIKRRESE